MQANCFLMVLAGLATGVVVFLIWQNCFFRKEIQSYQTIIQKLSFQRDFDLLSGLKNRNAFMRFIKENEGLDGNVSVLVCDIDGLKIINDTLGHTAGDEAIKKAGEIIRAVSPANAQVFRTGGDEYVIVVSEFMKEGELGKLKGKFKSLLSAYNENPGIAPLSLSIGYAGFTGSSQGFWDVYREADKNMYEEKRNRQDIVYKMIKSMLTI